MPIITINPDDLRSLIGRNIPDEELKKVTNMGDFIDYIERKVATKV